MDKITVPQHLAWLQPGYTIAIAVYASMVTQQELPPGISHNENFHVPTFILGKFVRWYNNYAEELCFLFEMLHDGTQHGLHHSNLALAGYCPCAHCRSFAESIAKAKAAQ